MLGSSVNSLNGNALPKQVLKGRVVAINPVDNTLTKAGFPADSKVTGDNIRRLDEAIRPFISHVTSLSNPHHVNAAQVGLGNVDNTADKDKPVSTAQHEAISGVAGSLDDVIRMLVMNDFMACLAVDDEHVLADDSGKLFVADWKYKEM